MRVRVLVKKVCVYVNAGKQHVPYVLTYNMLQNITHSLF